MHPHNTYTFCSNLAYSLLGNLLAAHYDDSMPFEDYAQEHIIKPLQMINTGFAITDEYDCTLYNYNCYLYSIKSHMAVGYYPNGNIAPLVDLGYISPAGQMYSTINDLNKVKP